MTGESCCHLPSAGTPKETLGVQVARYRPLLIIFIVSVLGAWALSPGLPLMHGLMGLFLLFIATLKWFDVAGFAALFQTYDPLARRVPLYARIYPGVELVLAVFYLGGVWPVFTNIALIVVLAITTWGVWRVIQTGRTVQCGCAGAGLNLPVGRVTLLENTLMIAMAAAMLIG